ncbi:MAG: glycosyltransferase 87 family protein [Clostridia bacterium]
MKGKKRTSLYAAAAAALIAVIAATCFLIRKNSAPADYLQICKFDFNDPERGYRDLGTDSYNAQGTEFAYVPEGGIDGTGCVAIHTTSANDARFTYKYDAALENTYYRMSVWVKTENVGTSASGGENEAVGANLSVLNTYQHSAAYTGSSDWTYIEFYGKTGKNQTSFTVCLRLGFYGGINTGTAYFDDFELEQLDALPGGAVSTSMEDAMNGSGSVQANAQHQDTMLAATAIVACITLYLIVAYRYARKRDAEAQQLDLISGSAAVSGLSVRSAVLILIAIGFAVRLVMSFTMPQCDIDVNLFQYWGRNLFDKGIPNFYAYAEQMNLDYPPLFLYHLYLLGAVGNIGNIGQSLLFDVLLKLPSMLADCVIAYILYKMAEKRMSKNWTMFLVAIWLFNPMVLLDSACWGQVDSLLALALLLSAYFIEKDRYLWAAVSLAFAVTLKPQGIFFVPILGFALLRQLIREQELPLAKRLLRFAYSIVGFFVTALLIILPFGIKMEPNLFSWIIGVYTNTAGGYTYATVNSFNFFYLLGANWVQDSASFLGLTYFAWGMIAIVALSLLTGVLYIFGKKKQPYVYLFSAMLIYTVATFGPRMHERYFYPALVLLLAAVLYSNNKLLLGIYGVLSISNFYTVLEVMTGLSIGGALIKTDYATASYYYWPPLNTQRALMGIFNVLCAVALIITACLMVFSKDWQEKPFQIWEETKEIYDGTDGDQDAG